MRMTRSALTVWVVLLGFSFPAFAAEANEASLEALVNAIQANKKAVVAVNLDLEDAEAKAFWPLYDQYQDDLDGLRDRFVGLVRDYVTNYETMDDAFAQQLVVDSLAIEQDRIALRQKYLKPFAEILPGRKVARFYQLENKMRAVIRYELAREIPVLATQSE